MITSVETLYQKYLRSGKVSTDTRQITPGAMFFALKGPNFNANALAEEAIRKGASYAVIDEAASAIGDRTLLVADVLTALQELARYHRSQMKIPIIGLTGSNGKTTSKELLHVVLRQRYKMFATAGNLNNHIGVPISILSIDATCELAVIEMGANHLGEIALLSSIAQPTHGFITNIGRAHIGTFGGFENIIRGKSELYQHLLTHHGVVFVNSQDEILANMARRFNNPVYYPAAGDYYHAEFLDADPFIRFRADDGSVIQTQLMGTYNFENIAAALCIGKYFGVPAGAAQQAVAEYVPGNMRSQIVQKGDNTIILDAYNANPSSMEAAIRNLAGMKATRKVAVLGDMYELEGETEKEHRNVGVWLKDNGIEEAYLCGPFMKAARASFPQARFFETRAELIEALRGANIRQATILVKASRGMALEKVAEVF